MSITDMDVYRAEKALERRYQDRIESEDAKQECVNALEAEIHETLKVQMLGAVLLGEGELPYTTYSSKGHHERAEHYMETVMNILDFPEIRPIVAKLLQESTCPIVKELRLAIAKRYADNNAADLAAVRSEE